MTESRRILLVSYFYPPGRDTGAQRPASLARHLRRLGHQVTVLTTSAYGRLPTDESPQTDGVEGDVVRTGDAQVLRARLAGKREVGALFDSDTYSGRPHPLAKVIVPEPLALAWAPAALRAAKRLQRERRFDCVITTSPPESAHSVGLALRRRGLPWIADIRDAWTFESLRPRFPTAAQRHLDERLERRWLSAADAVVCVSRPAAEDLRARAIADPIVIANGWDPESPDATVGSVPPGILDPKRTSIVYTGRFGSYGRDPSPLLGALARLAREHPGEAAKLELVFAGPLTEAERPAFEADVSPARIVRAGSLPRADALALQRAADVLLLIAAPARSQLANFKLFEYLAAGRPILALADGTEAGRIAAETGAGLLARSDDEDAIIAALRRIAAGNLPDPAPAQAGEYAYPAVAERFARVVESVLVAVAGTRNYPPRP